MFRIGDVVIYGSKGLFHIESIGTLDFVNDKTKDYYTLKSVFDKNGSWVYCPVEHSSYIRPVMKQEEIAEYLREIPDIQIDSIKNMRNADLINHYKEILDSHDFTLYLKTIREIIQKNAAGDQWKVPGQIDNQYLQILLNLVSQEIAYVYGESSEEAKNKVMQKCWECRHSA